jgi:hypothetical protein
MLGRYKFSVGQQVRLSEEGCAALIRPKSKRDNRGVVTKVDKFNSPTVRWKDRKTASSYHPDFIRPDHRRNLPILSAKEKTP